MRYNLYEIFNIKDISELTDDKINHLVNVTKCVSKKVIDDYLLILPIVNNEIDYKNIIIDSDLIHLLTKRQLSDLYIFIKNSKLNISSNGDIELSVGDLTYYIYSGDTYYIMIDQCPLYLINLTINTSIDIFISGHKQNCSDIKNYYPDICQSDLIIVDRFYGVAWRMDSKRVRYVATQLNILNIMLVYKLNHNDCIKVTIIKYCTWRLIDSKIENFNFNESTKLINGSKSMNLYKMYYNEIYAYNDIFDIIVIQGFYVHDKSTIGDIKIVTLKDHDDMQRNLTPYIIR